MTVTTGPIASSRGARTVEWLRRYLPCEIVSTIGELGGVVIAYAMTGSFVASAVAATVGGFAGYYGMAYVNAFRWSYRDVVHRSPVMRVVMANLLALRSVTVEFGPGEAVDSLLARPVTYYALPQLLGGNVIAGWLLAKIISDVAFYACTILSYERFTNLLAVRKRPVDPTPVAHDGREALG